MKYGIVTLVVTHFVIHLTYFSCDFLIADWGVTIFSTYETVTLADFMAFYFYGLDAIILGSIFIISNKDDVLQINRQLVNVTAYDLFVRASIYAAHHLRIYPIGSKLRITICLLLPLVAIIMVIISGRKYGFFDEEYVD